jgi:hypothetical protein
MDRVDPGRSFGDRFQEKSVSVWDSGKIRTIVEISSAGAVLLGLVFVGMELRQNTSVVSAQAIHDLNESANSAMLLLAQDAALADLTLRGNGHPQALNDAERQQYNAWVRAVFNIHESAWMYNKKGLIDDDDFLGWKTSICKNLQRQGLKEFWNANRGSWPKEFQEDVAHWCTE